MEFSILLSYHVGHGAGRACRNRVPGPAGSRGSGSSRSDLAEDSRQDFPSTGAALERYKSPRCPRYLAPQSSLILLKRFSRFPTRFRDELAARLDRAQGFSAPQIQSFGWSRLTISSAGIA